MQRRWCAAVGIGEEQPAVAHVVLSVEEYVFGQGVCAGRLRTEIARGTLPTYHNLFVIGLGVSSTRMPSSKCTKHNTSAGIIALLVVGMQLQWCEYLTALRIYHAGRDAVEDSVRCAFGSAIVGGGPRALTMWVFPLSFAMYSLCWKWFIMSFRAEESGEKRHTGPKTLD